MVRYSRFGVVIAFVLSAVGLAGADSCDRDPNVKGPPPARSACDTRPLDAPLVVRLGGQIAMKATAISECDKAPDQHVVSLWMEFKEGGTWTTQADKAGIAAGECREIPRRHHPVRCERLLFGACKNGRWRTRILVNGQGDGRPFSFTVPEKPEALVVCLKK